MDLMVYMYYLACGEHNEYEYIGLEHELNNVPEEILTNLTIEGYELGDNDVENKTKRTTQESRT